MQRYLTYILTEWSHQSSCSMTLHNVKRSSIVAFLPFFRIGHSYDCIPTNLVSYLMSCVKFIFCLVLHLFSWTLNIYNISYSLLSFNSFENNSLQLRTFEEISFSFDMVQEQKGNIQLTSWEYFLKILIARSFRFLSGEK